MSVSAAFTCITCRVTFADADLQRDHYKCDWHRYNLKRKVAELPPVTSDWFEQRALAAKTEAASKEKQAPKSSYCEPCGKKLSSSGAYESHLKSSKHKQNVEEFEFRKSQPVTPITETEPTEEDEDVELIDDEEWENQPLTVEECLFCSNYSKSLESNVKHMTREHNFYIPDIEYLIDLEGLVAYLGEKIGMGKMCLWCKDGGKTFLTTKSVQQHMIDKGHCMLRHEVDNAVEYADFYDYSSSYPAKPGDSENMEEEEVTPNILSVDETEYQMTLPSGAKIGHRALQKYYKQNLISRMNPEGKKVIKNLIGHYKALGWTGATGALAEVRKKDLGYMQREKQRHHQRLGVKSNKTSQMHFRQQVMF